MKARLPESFQNKTPNDMQTIIRQAQKMQDEIAKAEAELTQKDFTTSAAGGMIELTMSGGRVLKSVKINPEVVDLNNLDDLHEVIVAGVNAMIEKIDSVKASEIEKVTGGVNLPGLV